MTYPLSRTFLDPVKSSRYHGALVDCDLAAHFLIRHATVRQLLSRELQEGTERVGGVVYGLVCAHASVREHGVDRIAHQPNPRMSDARVRKTLAGGQQPISPVDGRVCFGLSPRRSLDFLGIEGFQWLMFPLSKLCLLLWTSYPMDDGFEKYQESSVIDLLLFLPVHLHLSRLEVYSTIQSCPRIVELHRITLFGERIAHMQDLPSIRGNLLTPNGSRRPLRVDERWGLITPLLY